MNQHPFQINPETEFYRGAIVEERAFQRHRGRRAMFIYGTLLSLLIIGSAISAITNQHITFFLLLATGGIVAFLFYRIGMRTYQRGEQPILEQEVEQRRQEERNAMYRAAQGELPLELRAWVLLLEGAIGLLLLGLGINSFVSFPPDASVRNSQGPILCILGILIVGMVVFVDRRRAKRLPEESAHELARRLKEGEVIVSSDPTTSNERPERWEDE